MRQVLGGGNGRRGGAGAWRPELCLKFPFKRSFPSLKQVLDRWMQAFHIGPTHMNPASPDEKPISAFASGTMVGVYRMEEELGRGGMGVVYKAVHTGLNKPVAIKVMGIAFSGNEQAIARLMSEGRTLAKLQHPNVVSVTDCGEFNGLPYLVLEYLEGGQSKVCCSAMEGGCHPPMCAGFSATRSLACRRRMRRRSFTVILSPRTSS